MADKKITQLNELLVAGSNDPFAVVDLGTNETKKITLTNLMGTPGPIGATTPSSGEFTTLDLSTGSTVNEISSDSTSSGSYQLLTASAIQQALSIQDALYAYIDGSRNFTGNMTFEDGLEISATKQLLLPQHNDAVTPTLAFGDGNTGLFESGDNTLNVSIAGASKFRFTGATLIGVSTSGPLFWNQNAGATDPTFSPDRGDYDTGIGSAGEDQLSLIAGGVEGIRITEDTIINVDIYGDLNTTGSFTFDTTGTAVNEISSDSTASEVYQLLTASAVQQAIVDNIVQIIGGYHYDLLSLTIGDDHTQYTHIDGRRNFTGNMTFEAGVDVSGGNLELSAGVAINEFSSDGTLAGNSDSAVPTEKAVKTYADTKEPSFSKNTAFNKNFAGTGAATTPSRSDHNHSATYLGISAKAADSSLLDNYAQSADASNDTIVRRNASGNIYADYFNMTASDQTSGVTKIAVEISNDNFIRWGTAEAIKTFIGSSSTTTQGIIEIATATETGTGTDATRAISPDGLAGSTFGERCVCTPVFGSDEGVATGDGTIAFAAPLSLNGYNLVDVLASVSADSTSGITDIQVRRVRSGSAVDMLSTKVTISPSEYFARDGVINTSNDDIATGDNIFIDVDSAGTGAQGLSVTLTFRKP
jgi:hypothetical protein